MSKKKVISFVCHTRRIAEVCHHMILNVVQMSWYFIHRYYIYIYLTYIKIAEIVPLIREISQWKHIGFMFVTDLYKIPKGIFHDLPEREISNRILSSQDMLIFIQNEVFSYRYQKLLTLDNKDKLWQTSSFYWCHSCQFCQCCQFWQTWKFIFVIFNNLVIFDKHEKS